MECVLVRPASMEFACISSADVASVHGTCTGAFATHTTISYGYCDVCVLKMREIFRFQLKAVD